MQTLFDLAPYIVELPPDPSLYSSTEMIEFIGEAERERDSERLFWLFSYLMVHGEDYSDRDYSQIFQRHEKALQVLDNRRSAA